MRKVNVLVIWPIDDVSKRLKERFIQKSPDMFNFLQTDNPERLREIVEDNPSIEVLIAKAEVSSEINLLRFIQELGCLFKVKLVCGGPKSVRSAQQFLAAGADRFIRGKGITKTVVEEIMDLLYR